MPALREIALLGGPGSPGLERDHQAGVGTATVHDARPSRPRDPRRLTLATKVANTIFGGGHYIRLLHAPSATDEPRYGYGRPTHARLSRLLSAHDDAYLEVLRSFKTYAEELGAIPLTETTAREPHWLNHLLFGLDGVSLYGFTRERAPRRYIEVGSGNSTLFVDRARRDGDLDTTITSIDPEPRREIDAICDTAIRQPLETADLGIFSDLRHGDVVFLDGTHRAFMNSDVTVFFLDVLPELPPGVLVGIHDVHLPWDYPAEHANSYYSEQYMLAAYLLAEPTWLRAVLPCWYVSHHRTLGEHARALTPWAGAADARHGVIFWLETRARP